jgi:hypothetical protein
MKYLFLIIICCITLSSCRSKEEKVVSGERQIKRVRSKSEKQKERIFQKMLYDRAVEELVEKTDIADFAMIKRKGIHRSTLLEKDTDRFGKKMDKYYTIIFGDRRGGGLKAIVLVNPARDTAIIAYPRKLPEYYLPPDYDEDEILKSLKERDHE